MFTGGIHIHIPVSPTVVRHRGRIYDRNGDSDIDITDIPDMVFQCYARKQSTYYVNKVYPYWNVTDLRSDLIDRARQMASARKRRDNRNESHPWESMNDEEMLRTSGLILTDEQGKTGITLAAVLLFGTDNMISSACAHHKTDCIYRVYNLDRYDDRDVIEIIIPLTTGAMTKVGPEISSEISGQVVKLVRKQYARSVCR